MFYRILALSGLFLICGLQVTAQNANKDAAKYGLDVAVSWGDKNGRIEVEVSAKATGKPAFPDSSIFSVSVSKIEYTLHWKEKLLSRKDKDILRNLTGQLKGGAFTVKGNLSNPGLYEVNATYDPRRQGVGKPQDLSSAITFTRPLNIGGSASSIPALEEELKMFDGDFTGKLRALVEESAKNVSTPKKWVEKYGKIIDGITALKGQLSGVKGTISANASFDVISITTSDFISYLQNFDTTSEKYVKMTAEGKDAKTLARDFRSSYGELADFNYFLNNIKVSKELFAREYTIHILYVAMAEVEDFADIYKEIGKSEIAEVAKAVADGLKDIKAGYEKLNIGDYKDTYTKYNKAVNDVLTRLGDLVRIYGNASDEGVIKSARVKITELLEGYEKSDGTRAGGILDALEGESAKVDKGDKDDEDEKNNKDDKEIK